MTSPSEQVPDEAVEAAARAAYEVLPVELFGDDNPVTWERLSDSSLGQVRKDHELTRARRALTAAAPFIALDVARSIRTGMDAWAGDKELGFLDGYIEAGEEAWL